MKVLRPGGYGRPVTTIVIALSSFLVSGLGVGDNKKPGDEPIPLTVPKAQCGPGDHPETGLQGQVPAALRAAGFKGFNCNLQLVGQSRGDGANWQAAQFREGKNDGNGNGNGNHNGSGHGNNKADRTCAYHGTASPTASSPSRNPATLGVPVVDLTAPSSPIAMGYLQTTSMLDPWESLKVNERRQLLAADDGWNGSHGPKIDVYDLSEDCRFPQLLASVPLGTGTDGGSTAPAPIFGHEGAWAPDGLTYYIGSTTADRYYHAIDMTDPTKPKYITSFLGVRAHGLSISDDGNRAYVAHSGPGYTLAQLLDPNVAGNNGFAILDTSDVQARLPNPQIRLISKFFYKDGRASQHTIPVKIEGKPYVIQVDEGGGGGLDFAGWQNSCAANISPFPNPRIVDISDETNPKLVSKIMLETHNPANCASVLPDVVGLSIFTYGSHYCSVDNRDKATTLACGFFNSGIRVFDIRDPARPKEIAYYNPAGTTTPSPGSNHVTTGQWRAGGPDWCSAQVHLDADRGTLWTTCQDNGVLTLKFTNNAWPFPQSKTPPGKQN